MVTATVVTVNLFVVFLVVIERLPYKVLYCAPCISFLSKEGYTKDVSD